MATPYRVSTITANGHIGTNVQQAVFFQHIHLVDLESDEPGFIWVEWGEEQSRGVFPKKRRKTGRKIFDNQVTVIYKMAGGYMPNIKLFRNGNIQMTGIRTVEDGQIIIERMTEEVRRIAKAGLTTRNGEEEMVIVEDVGALQGRDFTIRMINSDFSVPYKIRRKELHRILIDEYGNKCSFQPETYPGVKLQYFWNLKSNKMDGCCYCESMCIGKKNEETQCKKVTVSIFQSGKILITGATSFKQVDDAYQYITKILNDKKENIELNLSNLASIIF
jgi:TATA-box binding protein (TBP) (component of TFIID and TFIIIB)